MSSTPLNTPAFKELGAAIIRNTPDDMSEEDARYWAKNGKELKDVLRHALYRPKDGWEAASLCNMHGVSVSGRAKDFFLGMPGEVCNVKSKRMRRPRHDREIIKSFGDNMIFPSISDLEATLADLIFAQLKGGKGQLLVGNKSANIFYAHFGERVVYFTATFYERTQVSDQTWSIHCAEMSTYSRPAGSLVFQNIGYSE